MNHQLPNTPGFSTRSMRMTHRDGVIVAHLVDAETASAGDHTVTDPDECIEQFTRITNFKPELDTLIVEHRDSAGVLTPVAYAIVRTFKEADGPRVLRHMVKVHPLYLGQGVGTAVLDWCRGRLGEIGTEVGGHDPEGTAVVYRTTASNEAPRALPMLNKRGYEPVVLWAGMERATHDIPADALPDGVELRAVNDDQLRAIWEADVEAFRDHLGTRGTG